MMCWHKFNKWTNPVDGVGTTKESSLEYFKVLQMRICEKCGIAEVRELTKLAQYRTPPRDELRKS